MCSAFTQHARGEPPERHTARPWSLSSIRTAGPPADRARERRGLRPRAAKLPQPLPCSRFPSAGQSWPPPPHTVRLPRMLPTGRHLHGAAAEGGRAGLGPAAWGGGRAAPGGRGSVGPARLPAALAWPHPASSLTWHRLPGLQPCTSQSSPDMGAPSPHPPCLVVHPEPGRSQLTKPVAVGSALRASLRAACRSVPRRPHSLRK